MKITLSSIRLFPAFLYFVLACNKGNDAGPDLKILNSRSDYEVINTAPITKVLFHNPSRFYYTSMAASGAFAHNDQWEAGTSDKWYIEQQRNGSNAIIGGILFGVDSAIVSGFKAFDWGFAQQLPDGSFNNTSDAFHSTSFFVEAVAHTIIVIEQSPDAPKYASKVAAYKEHLHQAALWMIKPDVLAKGISGNAPYTHRRYLVAAALGLTGKIFNDAALISKSEDFIKDGLSLEAAEGYNPEKGGYDSSYDMVGIVYAERWLKAFSDNALATKVYSMIEKNLSWEQTRVLASGEVSAEGNTRTNGQEAGRTGEVKTIAYGSVIEAFGFWGVLTNNDKWKNTAWKISSFKGWL